MKAIILAAGEGKRMRPLILPKCMLKYNNSTVLDRLIRQIREQGIDDITVVVGYKREMITSTTNHVTFIVNDRFKEDTNSYSMYLGLKNASDDDVVVFESDMIAEDALIKYVFGTDFENKSVWFTQGKPCKKRNGGIVKTNGNNNILDIKVLDSYSKEYRYWHKLNSVLRITKENAKIFCNLLKQVKNKNQYYHTVWRDNIENLPSIFAESKAYTVANFNTYLEYYEAIRKRFDIPPKNREIHLAKIDDLYPIEYHDSKRIPAIKKSVIKDGMWIKPIKVEGNSNLVLDGHHSLALAKQMGLIYIPVIYFDYHNIKAWSLREEISIKKDDIIRRAKRKELYPYKTIKHKFPNTRYDCNIRLNELEERA